METQTKPAPPKVVVAPEGEFMYLTPGKEYKVTEIWGEWNPIYGYGFFIIDDLGSGIDTMEIETSHLNGLNWIIKEREGGHE